MTTFLGSTPATAAAIKPGDGEAFRIASKAQRFGERGGRVMWLHAASCAPGCMMVGKYRTVRLLLQRLPKLPRALLLCLEQSCVFNRDHRLVSEGLHQKNRTVAMAMSLLLRLRRRTSATAWRLLFATTALAFRPK
jgi:hypothetical protein